MSDHVVYLSTTNRTFLNLEACCCTSAYVGLLFLSQIKFKKEETFEMTSVFLQSNRLLDTTAPWSNKDHYKLN